MLPFGSLAGAPRPPDHDGTGTPPSPLLTVQEVDGGSRPPNTDPEQAFPSPVPLLTVEKKTNYIYRYYTPTPDS